LHGVFDLVFDNRLIFPPVVSPRRILDLGCGGGDWAAAVARQYPNSEVRHLRRSYLTEMFRQPRLSEALQQIQTVDKANAGFPGPRPPTIPKLSGRNLARMER
jgi:tRNA G46 methylase TrmB